MNPRFESNTQSSRVALAVPTASATSAPRDPDRACIRVRVRSAAAVQRGAVTLKHIASILDSVVVLRRIVRSCESGVNFTRPFARQASRLFLLAHLPSRVYPVMLLSNRVLLHIHPYTLMTSFPKWFLTRRVAVLDFFSFFCCKSKFANVPTALHLYTCIELWSYAPIKTMGPWRRFS